MQVPPTKFKGFKIALCLLVTTGWMSNLDKMFAADSKPVLRAVANPANAATPPNSGKHVDFKFPAEGSLSMIVVQSPDKQSATKVTEQTRRFFKAKDFDGLEELGNRLCKEKHAYLNGEWQITTFFDALSRGLFEDNTTEDDWQKNLQVLQEWEKKKPKSLLAKTALMQYWRGYAFRGRNESDGRELM